MADFNVIERLFSCQKAPLRNLKIAAKYSGDGTQKPPWFGRTTSADLPPALGDWLQLHSVAEKSSHDTVVYLP